MKYKIIEENEEKENNKFKPFLCKHGNIIVNKESILKNSCSSLLIGVYKDGIRYYLEIDTKTEEVKFKKDNGNYVNSEW